MLQSYGIYIGTLLISWLFAFLADKYNNKRLIWIIIILYTIIAGFRGNTVGIDTFSYYSNIKIIETGALEKAYGFETSFKYLSYILMKIYNNPVFVFTVLALITNACIVVRLWDFRKIASFSCMVSYYYMSFFFMTMNVTRQFVSIAIIFYATRYLVEKKHINYIIFVLLAMIFHQSSVIGIVLPIISLMDWKTLSTRQKTVCLMMVPIIPLVIEFLVRTISKYDSYLKNNTVDVGMMVFVKLVFFVATVLFVFVLRGNGTFLQEIIKTDHKEKMNIILICTLYFVGICFALSSYYIPIFNRVGWYFIIFENVYFGMLIKCKLPLNKMIFIYIITFIVGYAFIYSMTSNSQGTMPYMFFWQ